ncbi:AraC family transcriptional regulator [Martelella endophytica]|uniref:AraC family transcriptional regulator n=1 Tax=Martelella endophytica TaxID=1486262 RepID=UPI0009E3476B
MGLRLGYRDSSYFSRRFRALQGVTPSDYRERFSTRVEGGSASRPAVGEPAARREATWRLSSAMAGSFAAYRSGSLRRRNRHRQRCRAQHQAGGSQASLRPATSVTGGRLPMIPPG